MTETLSTSKEVPKTRLALEEKYEKRKKRTSRKKIRSKTILKKW